MNSANSNSASPTRSGRVTRASLACLPCRSRHLKCDGKRPQCSRCTETSQQCDYARSRRGGLDRAALAERRKRLAEAEAAERVPPSDGLLQQDPEHPDQFSQVNILDDDLLVGTIDMGNVFSNTNSPAASPGYEDIAKDALVKSYYENFHKFHPFALPRRHLIRLYQSSSMGINFKPLLAVQRLIGHLYSPSGWSTPLKALVEDSFSQASQTDPIMVQCRLLYSIALFWHNYKADAKREMDTAGQLARNLGMFHCQFATEHGGGDSVLIESWRRTWWELYIVDGYYAGTLGTMNFVVLDIEATVDLPCEEDEYESGNIPVPKTLQDFDCREFSAPDTPFSSFAYLIGAVRCTASAISTAPTYTGKEASENVIQAADSILDGWLLLLPKDSKQVMRKSGEIDELMFQAHLLVHVATIGIHRPLSDLKFNAVEDISSCAREPPLDTPTPDLINVHTVRVLRSVESQIRLLTLPVRPFHHTPFVTCMTSEGTLALLSACNFLLKGKELAVARDQIRMTIGCLRALGEVWPRTARNVQEIQAIARHVLGLGSKTSSSNTPQSSEVPSLSGGDGQGSGGSEAVTSVNGNFADTGALDSVCGWYNLGDLGPDLSWWPNNDDLS